MKHITVDQFKRVIEMEAGNNAVAFINVCTPVEYNECHIEGVDNIPLNVLVENLERFKDKQTVYIHCRSGSRGRLAIETLQKNGVTAELVNVEGGLLAWQEAGFTTKSLISPS